MGLFVAFSIPAEVQTALRPTLKAIERGKLAMVPEGNLHITVAFLGERDDLEAVNAALEAGTRGCAPAAVRLDGLSGFPRPSRARVVYAGIVDPDRTLTRNAEKIRAALAEEPVGWIEREDFVPHITLARVRRSRRPLEVPSEAVEPAVFEVSSVELFHSVLQGRKPPRYDVLGSFPFTPSTHSA